MQPPTDPPPSASGPPPPEASAPPPGASAPQPPELRQRWRLVFRRGQVSSDHVGRTAIEAWQEALIGCGLALAQLDASGRPRIAFGAPLAATAEGEAELAEIFLAERVPAWRLREALAERLPASHTLLSAEDVWLGAPPLPGRVTAADWHVELEPAGIDPGELRVVAERLLGSPSLPRTRSKGGSDKPYDLRPLLDDVEVSQPAGPGEAASLRIRTRFHPELGSGRPEEVVAALAEALGSELVVRRIVRKRLLLIEDVPSRTRP